MPQYDVFISYCHTRDRPLAAALQRLICTLGRPWYKRWSLWVFRDDTSLSAAPGLWTAIEQALQQARFLILLASPEAAASPWVEKEVAFWLATKGPQTLLIALTDSDLAWDPAGGDFAWSAATPLPPSLKGRLPEEPKWVDLRPFRSSAQLRRQRHRTFAKRAAELAAVVHGLPKEDLLADEIHKKRRGLWIAWTVAVAMTVVAGAALWWRPKPVADACKAALGAITTLAQAATGR